jgi:hypothetical protein
VAENAEARARRAADFYKGPPRLDGDLTRAEIIEALQDLRFGRGADFVQPIEIDQDVRARSCPC